MFAVVPTHEAGRRRSREHMASAVPVIGSLKMSDWKEGSSFNRSIRIADLHDLSTSCHPALLPTLFDASVVKVTFKGSRATVRLLLIHVTLNRRFHSDGGYPGPLQKRRMAFGNRNKYHQM
jgi:hypothetical protein